MTKDDIQAFSAVASLRSYTKAAALLFVTESSLSKKITRLEKEVGVQLLDRSRHGVSLTAAGRVFLEESRGVLGEMDRFLEDVRAAAEDVRLPLHLAVMGTSLGNRVLPVFLDFRSRHRSLSLTWSVLSFHEIYDALDHGRVDGAVASDLGLSTIPHIRTLSLGTAGNSLVLPKGHPFMAPHRDFGSLREETFLVLDGRVSRRGKDILLSLCASWGFHPKVRELGDTEEILFQVRAGKGAAILPAFDLPKADPLLEFVDLPRGKWDNEIVFAWNGKTQSRAVRLLVEYLKGRTSGLACERVGASSC
ncbi:LysR family transcriptional regulator [uncultured Dialister sp.]|jgi:DNA-binding transcriptional LysR family regulator|uniref:LysR family transcriptional regulator n=1 Tax=uncultured Dialister sp. TaxID=278064 RepID=UPI0025DB658C|nr:LysR family transcriptional regulator [uncultured Dialister sp.]